VAKPKDKAGIIKNIKLERRRLEKYFPDLTPEQIELSRTIGEWSIKDLLAHITAWEQIFLGWYNAGLSREKVILPAPGFTWSQMDELNKRIYEENKDKSFEEVKKEADVSFRQVLEAMEDALEASLIRSGYFSWTGDDTLAHYLSGCTDLHYKWAWQSILRLVSEDPRFRPSKEEIIEEVLVERRRLEKNLSALTPEQMVEPGVVGEWSVKDIMAHLTAWEKMFLGWYNTGSRGEVPEVPALGYDWSNYHLLNQKISEGNKDRSLQDVQEEFESHYQHTLGCIREIPEEEWFVLGLYEWMEDRVRIVRYIQANTGDHYRWAKNAIRKWLREK